MTTILKSHEEIRENNKRVMRGEEPLQGSKNEVKDMPPQFKKWVDENQDRIARAKTLPYFLRDNEKLLGLKPSYGSVNAVTGAKFGRTATKEAIRVYENIPAPKLTDEVIKNTRQIADAFGIKASIEPMTFLEANEGRANVNYGRGVAFTENCQCCVAVHEARLRGLNLTALGYQGTEGSVSKELGDCFQKVWLNAKTGKMPQVTMVRGNSEVALFEKLDKATYAKGRYHIGVNFGNDSGHVITAERMNSGKIFFYDAQSGEFVDIKEYANLESFEVLKVDKLLLNRDLLLKISQLI